ncbi:hypothetical protein PsYK624_148340 [Phanerochaete sordida]|uniref:F-box domain-containing protein n=1 Tax=Phanerochaete sordida TaxID=48140 RepID=A0A9P3GNA8_9APHY|nr:hypothetical protein PsYK624_148340 [Phanerochaete sordida]
MLATTTDIFSLPLELLCCIFSLLSDEAQDRWIMRLKLKADSSLISWSAYESHASGEDARSGYVRWRMDCVPPQPLPYAWTRISHVCRAWRGAALSDPRLWTHAAVFRRETLATVVQRAKGLPLTVSFRGLADTRAAEAFEWLLNTHPAQIGTLVMPFISPKLTAPLAARMPRLKALHLIEFTPAEQPAPDADSPSAFAALEHIESVAALRFPITYLCTAALKSLVLVHRFPGAHFEGQYLPTIDELTHALVRSPHLERLEVVLGDAMPHPQAAVALPALRTLRVTALTKVCAAALRAFRTPRTTRVLLTCLAPLDSPDRDWSVITKAVSQVLAAPAAQSSRFAPVASLDAAVFPWMYKLRGWRTERGAQRKADGRRAPPDVEITIDVPSAVEDIVEVLAPLTLLDAQTHRQGCLNVAEVGRAAFDFAQALCTMPQLRNLVLDVAQSDMECQLLHDTTARSVTMMAPQVPTEETGPKEEAECKAEPWLKECVSYAGHLQDIVDICGERKDSGKKLCELVLNESGGLGPELVADLEKVVDSLVCAP